MQRYCRTRKRRRVSNVFVGGMRAKKIFAAPTAPTAKSAKSVGAARAKAKRRTARPRSRSGSTAAPRKADPPVSAYEQERVENMRRNDAKLRELGLPTLAGAKKKAAASKKRGKARALRSTSADVSASESEFVPDDASDAPSAGVGSAAPVEEAASDQPDPAAPPQSLRERLLAMEDSEDDEDLQLTARKAYSSAFRRSVPSRRATSTNTLSQLDMLSSREVKAVLSRARPKNARAKRTLRAAHKSRFREWFLQLKAGFNVLLYGLGSKKELVQRFAREWLRDGPVLVVHGYFPMLRTKTLLDTITTNIMQAHSRSFESELAQVDYIREFLSEWAPNVYVLLHSIDGECLRSERAQSVLSRLASVPQIRVVATCDHILAPMLWNARNVAEFSWLAHDATTFVPYTAETQYAVAVMGGDREDRARGIEYVLKSLTPNHHEILTLLATEQLGDSPSGLDFHEFLGLCQDAMLVSSELDMKNHLNEMKDHRLVDLKRTDGLEKYIIPYAPDIIKEQILKQKPEEGEGI